MPQSEHNNIAGTVVRDDQGRYLMVQEKKLPVYGLWNISAGHQELGETEQETAVREIYEEVGLRVELLDDTPIHTEHSEQEGNTYFAFLGKIVGGELEAQADEILNAEWLAFPTIQQLHKEGKIRAPWIMTSIQKAEDAYSRH
jgi:8-oxo-dGTP pyrophosphatase MutT (NUDIX family)